MRDALNAVNDRAGKVVCGVGLVLIPRAQVGRVYVAPEHGRIAHCLVLVLHVYFGAQHALPALGRALEHLLKEPHVFLDAVLPRLGRNAVHALLPHLLHGRVIHIAVALPDELARVLNDDVEMVRCVGHLPRRDADGLQVFDDVFHKLALLLRRVGVVEPDEHPSVVLGGVKAVQQRGLHVADVQVTAGLGREARDHLPHLCICKGRDLADGADALLRAVHLLGLGCRRRARSDPRGTLRDG
mmetsp:Transcript_23454/g.58692  ORF Transcript_23454/g.58692 Transcript_23454/m.58692 type:complete len:242 (+) Transcript_23454:1081-1806(+)